MIKKILKLVLMDIVDKLDAGTCEMSEEEMMKALDILLQTSGSRELSKDLACSYINMSRSSFDNYISLGLLPKGKKVRGFKELSWYKEDLDLAVSNIKKELDRVFILTHSKKDKQDNLH